MKYAEINVKKNRVGKGIRKCICGGSVAILNKVIKEGYFSYLPFFTRWDRPICISNDFCKAES